MIALMTKQIILVAMSLMLVVRRCLRKWRTIPDTRRQSEKRQRILQNRSEGAHDNRTDPTAAQLSLVTSGAAAGHTTRWGATRSRVCNCDARDYVP
jgi:hypothetical protein